VQELGFIQKFDEIKADYGEGEIKEIPLPDGSKITLKKLQKDFIYSDRSAAAIDIKKSLAQGQILTGLFYLDTQSQSFIDTLNMTATPLAQLDETRSRPSPAVLKEILAGYRYAVL